MRVPLIVFFCLKLSDGLKFIIDVKAPTTEFEHFWESTGLCPPDPKSEIYKFLLSNQERFNLALIGALPNKAIKQVRIHWLFNLIFNRNNKYDFTFMDELIDFLIYHDLKPHFELMGFPVDMNRKLKIHLLQGNFWKNLVEILACRYIAKFGYTEILSWKFELWNEPDLKNYNILNFTLAEYLEYANGCAEGLKRAFIGYKSVASIGGPAGLFRKENHPLCWGLLESCLGNSQCPIQFISFHRKGDGTAEGVLNGTLELLDLLHNKFPNLTMPIANDESDIITTWSANWEWRADARYAAMVVKVIADHYKSVALDRKLKIELLSFDNAFLNYHPFYFTQRTLLVRFQMNNTSPPHNQFIKKPIYITMGLLSFLEDAFIRVKKIKKDSLFTVMATRTKLDVDQSCTAILLAYADGDEVNIETIKSVKLTVNHLSIGSRFVVYLVDNEMTNPYKVWMENGKPAFPSSTIREKMRKNEGPHRLLAVSQVLTENLTIPLKLTIPSVTLIHVCSKPSRLPGPVTKLTIFNVTWNEVLLTWSSSKIATKCIRTYEVEFESKCSNSLRFVRVNPADIIFLSYHHATTGDGACERTIGRYRVRAMDYWDQPGNYSEIVSFP